MTRTALMLVLVLAGCTTPHMCQQSCMEAGGRMTSFRDGDVIPDGTCNCEYPEESKR